MNTPEFPELLTKLHSIEIDYSDENSFYFEPFENFYSREDTSNWIKAWTGNNALEGNEYLIFGQDGSGGYVAFWCIRTSENLLDQPIVFFGSEGEIGVIAKNFYDYVWLFANGIGPYEAVAYPDLKREQLKDFFEFAVDVAHSNQASPSEIVARAKAEFPDFEDKIRQLCR